ncbi:MAG: KH domain-containing protein [Lentisphaerales bacterium]|nr:KH domain-containing protein [Lentisphaerales bacterium]
MLGFLKKLFSGSDSELGFNPKPTGGVEDLEMFVKYVVTNLVDKPQVVNVESEQREKVLVIKVTCQKEDVGKIIGKNGKTIEAIRSLVNGAAGRLGTRANVEVAD